LHIEVTASSATKCERCWHWRDDVGQDPAHPTICGRCDSNLHGAGRTAHGGLTMAAQTSKSARRPRPGCFWLGLAAIVILADQITKTLIVGQFAAGRRAPVVRLLQPRARAQRRARRFPSWPTRPAGNAGSSSAWAGGVSVFIVYMLRAARRPAPVRLGAGADPGRRLGNVHGIDRLLYGHVIDFLQFHWVQHC
jgi:lipoprotein signal peptidase